MHLVQGGPVIGHVANSERNGDGVHARAGHRQGKGVAGGQRDARAARMVLCLEAPPAQHFGGNVNAGNANLWVEVGEHQG